MIVELALAVGVLTPLPPAVLAPIPVLDDCARPKLIETPRPRVHKPGLVTHRRLFKHEPKPEEPDCGTGVLPPIFTVLTPEEPHGFSPAPEPLPVPLVTADVPLRDVYPVEDSPPGRAFASDGLGVWAGPVFAASAVSIGSVAAIPEPGVWAIFAFGVLGMFGWKAREA